MASFTGPVDEYLARSPFSVGQPARQHLAAVLAQANGRPALSDPAWDQMVDLGLAMLLPIDSELGYAALPVTEPPPLTPGASFTINAPALGYLSADSVPGRGYLFEIEWPEAQDIARLAGDNSGRIMLAAGTPFVVKKIFDRGGRTVIRLAHRAGVDVAVLEASRLRREQQPPAETAADPQALERHRKTYITEFRILQEWFEELASSPAAAQSPDTVSRGRFAIELFSSLSGATTLSQVTIAWLGQQYANLREATRDLAEPFAGLPGDAFAVRSSDGAYMRPPGDESAQHGHVMPPLTQLFSARNELLPFLDGESTVTSGVVSVSVDPGGAGALDPAVLYPAMWYLAAQSYLEAGHRAPEIRIQGPVPAKLADELSKLGMTASILGRRFSRVFWRKGPTRRVADLAAAAARAAGWILRPSDRIQPTGAASSDFNAQVNIYLRRNPSLAGDNSQQAQERLNAVIMEARAQALSLAAGPPAGRHTRVAGGLGLLPRTGSIEGYAAALPGADPADLNERQEISVTAPALGYVFRESVRSGSALFVIDRPDARDVSRLAGDPFGRIMFAPGTRFVVERIEVERLKDEGSRRVIYLSHPEEPPTHLEEPPTHLEEPPSHRQEASVRQPERLARRKLQWPEVVVLAESVCATSGDDYI